jgi:hypothetical protein
VARDESHAPARDDQSAAAQPPSSAPAFDPASLPSLDSITATTDVRPFLQPGVPSALTREALRRMWSADSAIRDFVGLQEYDWDYNTPGAIAGFGELGSEHNIKEMLARVFGEHPSAEGRAETAPGQPVVQVEELPSAGGPEGGAPDTQPPRVVEAVDPLAGPDDSDEAVRFSQSTEELVQRNREVAMQQDDLDSQNTPKIRRSHGGALPQ